MVGAVGKCENGLMGVICKVDLSRDATGKKTIFYSGVGLDGKSWGSFNPQICAKSINEYIEKFVIPNCSHKDEVAMTASGS